MLDKARDRRKLRPKIRAGEEFPLLNVKSMANVFRSVPQQLPKWKQQLGTAVEAGREKLGGAYSAVARLVALRKEALQDRLAERRSRTKAARGKKTTSSSRRKK